MKGKARSTGVLDQELFEILACPVCKSDLDYSKGGKGLVCSKCKEHYPIKQGIPILLPPGYTS